MMKIEPEPVRRSVLFKARENFKDAESTYIAVQKAYYPVGSPVTWKKGAHVQSGRITGHQWSGGFFATNNKTGRNVKITVYDIIEAGK